MEREYDREEALHRAEQFDDYPEGQELNFNGDDIYVDTLSDTTDE